MGKNKNLKTHNFLISNVNSLLLELETKNIKTKINYKTN